MIKGIYAINRDKRSKLKSKRQEQHKKFIDKMSKLDAQRDTRIKERKKKLYRLIGQEEKRKQKVAARGGK